MPDNKNITLADIEKKRIEIKKPERESGKEEKVSNFEEKERIAQESVEKKEEVEIEKNEGKEGEVGIGASLSHVSDDQKKRKKKIEKVLESDLEDIYLSMPPGKQREFKVAGERTAVEINKILDKAKVKVKNIIKLIRQWLSIIPGISRYFLEQETKIKTDEIMKLKK